MYHDCAMSGGQDHGSGTYFRLLFSAETSDGNKKPTDYHSLIHMWDRQSSISCGSSDLFHARLRPNNSGSWMASIYDVYPDSLKQHVKFLPEGVAAVDYQNGFPASVFGVIPWLGEKCFFHLEYHRTYMTRSIYTIDGLSPSSVNQYEDVMLGRTPVKTVSRCPYWPETSYSTPSEETWVAACESRDALRIWNTIHLSGIRWVPTSGTSCEVLSWVRHSESTGRFSFKHNEYGTYVGYHDIGMLPNLYRNGFGCAATEAAKHLPNVGSNGVANVIQISDTIIGIANIMRGNLSGLTNLKDPRNAWLAWRYSYNTTKADVMEYASIINRLQDLAGSDHIRVGGLYSRDDLTFRVTTEYATDDVIPSDVKGACKQFNLELSAYNMWDLIPYSFVVDWFLHIGDLLERYELYDTIRALHPVKSWCSFKSAYKVEDGYQDVYARFGGLSTPDFDAPWYYQHTGISKKTGWFRFADGIALFTK